MSASGLISSASLVYIPSQEDNFDNISSLSYNSRLLEQFRNLGESASQVGGDPY
jgi:hypothetical protein